MIKKTTPQSSKTTTTASRRQLDSTGPVKVHENAPESPRVKATKRLKKSPINRYMLTINAHHEAPALIRVDPAVARSFTTHKVIRKHPQDYEYYPDHDNGAREEVIQTIRDGSSNCLMIGVSYEACAELHELAQKSPEKAFQRLTEFERDGCATEPATPYDTIRYALVCEPFRKLHLKYLIERTAFM